MESGALARFGSLFKLITVLALVIVAGCSKPLSDEEYVERAKGFQDEGKYRAAVIELKNALAQNRDNLDARWLLGNLYLMARNGTAAEKELRRAQELGLAEDAVAVPLAKAVLLQGDYARTLREAKPSASLSAQQNAELYGFRAQALMAQGKLDAAQRELEQALAVEPPPDALIAKARLVAVLGRRDEAKQWLDKALAANPGSVEGWSTLGDLERDRKNLEQAEAAYSKAIDLGFGSISDVLKRALVRIVRRDFEGAEKDLEAVQRMRPNVPGYHYAKGLIALRKQQFADAQSQLERTLTLDAGYQPALLYLGVAHASQGHLEQADHYLSRYVTAKPQSKVAAELLARVRLRKADAAGAQLALNNVLARDAQDAQTYEVLADVALAAGDYDRGIQYLRERVAAGDDSALLRTKLGVAYLGEGDREKAREELERALKLDPKFSGAKVALILDFIQQGKFEEAIQAAKELQQTEPGNPYGHTLAGVAHGRSGQEDAAKAAFGRALELRPGEPVASMNLAAYAAHEGNQQRARELYQGVLRQHPGYLPALLRLSQLEAADGKPDRALNHLEAAVQANPTSLEARLLLARAYLTMSRPSEAVRVAEQGLKLNEHEPALLETAGAAYLQADNANAAVQKLQALVRAQPQRAEAHFMLAEAYGKAKQPQAMKAQLERALLIDPEYFAARRVLARAQLFDGQIEAAEQNVQQLKQQAPDDPDVIAMEAAIAVSRGQTEQALALYRNLFERAPSTASMLSLARQHWDNDDRQTALRLQQKWVSEHPDDIRARLALAEAHTALGDQRKALEQYEHVLSQDRNNLVALNNLAWALKDAVPQKALTYAERAATLAPDSIAALDTLAVVQLSAGETQQALRTSERLWAKIDPKQATTDVVYHRALVLANGGRASAAAELLDKLLRQHKDFPEREAAEQLRQKLGEK